MTAFESTIRRLCGENRARELIDYYAGLDPKERRALHPLSKTLVAESRRERTDFTAVAQWETTIQRTGLASLAFLCTATGKEIAARKSLPADLSWLAISQRGNPRDPSLLLYLVERLRPAWTNELVELVLSRVSTQRVFFAQELIIGLVQRGWCERPRHPAFFSMLLGLRWTRDAKPRPLAELAVQEARWVVPTLYEGFLQPEAGELTRVRFEPGEGTAAAPDASWQEAIRRLAAEGLLDRIRMTETIFGALAMHAKPSVTKWLTELFDVLWPEAAERARWIGQGDLGLLSALHAPAPGVGTWALRHLEGAVASGGLTPAELLAAMAPVLQQGRKAAVLKGLSALRRIVQRDRSLAAAAAVEAACVLLLPELEVQEKLAGFLEDVAAPGDPMVRSALAGYAESIHPALRSRFFPWLGEALLEAAAVEGAADELIPPPEPLADEARLDPISDVDGFISLLGHWYQNWYQPGSDPDLLHRLLGAFGTLNECAMAERPRRAEALIMLVRDRWHFGPVATNVAFLLATWLGEPEPSKFFPVMHGLPGLLPPGECLFRDYAAIIARRMQQSSGGTFEMLSTPTHWGGWIDPRELVARLGAPSRPATDPLDLTLALLRIAPGHRTEALAAARHLEGTDASALRYALGDDSIAPVRNCPVWLAAIRARYPYENPAILEDWSSEYDFPDGTRLAEFVTSFHPASEPSSPLGWYRVLPARLRLQPTQSGRGVHALAARHSEQARDGWIVPEDFRWLLSVWPASHHAFFPLAVDQLGIGAGSVRAESIESGELVCVGWATLPPHPLGPAGNLLLALALNSPSAATRQAAGEALFRNLQCGLTEAAEFGQQVAALLRAGCAKLNRLVPTLRETAALSARTSRLLAEAMAGALDLGGGSPPRFFNQLLEWMLELGAQHPEIALSEASRQTLRTLDGSGKTGQLVAKLTREVGRN